VAGDLANLDSIAKRVVEHTRTVLLILTILTVEHVRRNCIARVPVIHFRFTDLRALGQTTRLERSTLAQVQARIAFLREKTKEASSAKAYDFNQRLEEVKAKEITLREQRKALKKAEKEKVRLELIKDTAMDQDDDDMSKLMGFGGFGTSKK
jgi:hypothetical protein